MSSAPSAKQQFVIVKDIAASPEQVFKSLCSATAMKAWVPMCRSATWRHPPGVHSPGLGSVRVFELPGRTACGGAHGCLGSGHRFNYRFEPPSPFRKAHPKLRGRDLRGADRRRTQPPELGRSTSTRRAVSPLLEPVMAGELAELSLA